MCKYVLFSHIQMLTFVLTKEGEANRWKEDTMRSFRIGLSPHKIKTINFVELNGQNKWHARAYEICIRKFSWWSARWRMTNLLKFILNKQFMAVWALFNKLDIGSRDMNRMMNLEVSWKEKVYRLNSYQLSTKGPAPWSQNLRMVGTAVLLDLKNCAEATLEF
jgi:hypothetical protein